MFKLFNAGIEIDLGEVIEAGGGVEGQETPKRPRFIEKSSGPTGDEFNGFILSPRNAMEFPWGFEITNIR